MIILHPSIALAMKVALLSITDVPASNGISPENTLHLRHHHSQHSSKSYQHEDMGRGGQSNSNNFDFYVYSMTYQPEFCRENNEKFVGCKRPDEYWEKQLTIHGLWPQRLDGTWPSTCTSEPLDTSKFYLSPDNTSILPDMEQKWPNVKAAANSGDHSEFWAHEWSKHGTCSGLMQFDYFHSALGLLLDTPAVVREGYGTTVDKKTLLQGYGGDNMAALVCKSGYLSEVRACFEKNEDGTPGERMECPEKVLSESSCSDQVYIASFGMAAADVQ
ncbi:hypothetical protein HJC23_013328 [Cyclotella cryptica]|uniref:Uncharacterized protein n=1 Tax=Cyclotella cryptica TaxID=29204 RepID=A0ABD3Q1F7_9STRA|eukprot:CCRYP_009742-RB/>CCRYP_009742-RB protein AED:0.14 eAED:0.14 QI:469/1/1/1/0.5/0.33/3/36/273